MPHEPQEGLPASLTVGDTWTWKRSSSEHRATAGWTLRYEFSRHGTVFAFNAAADGDNHLLTVAATQTASIQPGTYRWAEVWLKGDERYTEQHGRVEIDAVFAVSRAEYWVRFLREAIEDIVTGRFHQRSINNRSYTQLDLDTLNQMLAKAEAEVEQQAHAGFGPQFAARFQLPRSQGAPPVPPEWLR